MRRKEYIDRLRAAATAPYGLKLQFETPKDARFVALKLRNMKRTLWFRALPDADELHEIAIREVRPNQVWLIPLGTFSHLDDSYHALGEAYLTRSELEETDKGKSFRRGSIPRSRRSGNGQRNNREFLRSAKEEFA